MGNYVVIALGDASRDFRGMIKLNDTAAEIWGYINEGKTLDEIAAVMLEKYEIDEEKLRADIEATTKTLAEQGILEL